MKLYESQLEIRARLDRESTQKAYEELAAGIGSEARKRHIETDTADKTVHAIEQCLSFYGAESGDVPDHAHDELEKLEYACRPSGIMYRKVRLEKEWYRNTFGPLLGHSNAGKPVALIPGRIRGYSMVDPETGVIKKVNAASAAGLSEEAIFFYRAFPGREMGLKDLLAFMIRSLSFTDYAAVLLMAVAATFTGLLPPWVNRLAFGTVIPSENAVLIAPIAALLTGVVLCTVLINACRELVMKKMSQKMGVYSEAAAYARLLTLPSSFFRNYDSGDLAFRVTSLRMLSEQLIMVVLGAGMTAILSLIFLIQIFTFTPSLTVPALGIVAVQAAFTVIAAIMTMRYEKEKLDANVVKSGLEISMLGGIRKIKLAGAEDRAFVKWANKYTKYLRPAYNRPGILNALPAVVTVIGLLGTVLIYNVAVAYKVEMPDFMAFNVAYGQMGTAILAASNLIGMIVQIRPIMELCRPILSEIPEKAEYEKMVDRLSGAVEISNVSFRYSEKSPYVLKDLSVRIRPGEYVAIVGRSGCGKSTLVRLLLGFEMPETGRIYYDSYETQTTDLRSLRQCIGTVLQNGKLFMGNIFYNIVISSPNSTEEDAWEAAEAAGIAQDIKDMPMGMQTLITEAGGGLSGGQRQRLMIARAVCGKPSILILDEATSALDNITQKYVSDSLDKLNCTRIVVAHRLSTIKNCDRIICIDQGRVVEEGTYTELMKNNGFFAELVRLQQLDQGEESY